MSLFAHRTQAGRRLARELRHLEGDDVVVVGLPRGGVPVAAEVAEALDAPLDVIVVRKLGVPFQPELGMGAIGEGGVTVLNDDVIQMTGVSTDEIAAVEAREHVELDRRAQRFRSGRQRIPLTGKVVVVVDDGIATGSTARAACQVARALGAARVVLAVPVAPEEWTERLADAADELVCVATPVPFFAIGEFYDDFTQTTDDEVIDCLQRAAPPRTVTTGDGPGEDRPASRSSSTWPVPRR
jgi:putative phosphoribosyl transferase